MRLVLVLLACWLLFVPAEASGSPPGSAHLTLTGRYRIALAEALRDRSAYRELNQGRPSRPNPVFRTNSP